MSDEQQKKTQQLRPTSQAFVPTAQEFVPAQQYVQQNYGGFPPQQQQFYAQNYSQFYPQNSFQNYSHGGYPQGGYPQQSAYVAPQQQAYRAPVPAGPAKSISLGSSGPAKAISLGGGGPAKSISIGASNAAPAKSISIGGSTGNAPAKSISIGGGGPAKSISIAGSGDKKEAVTVAPAKKESAPPAVSKKDTASPSTTKKDPPSSPSKPKEDKKEAVAASAVESVVDEVDALAIEEDETPVDLELEGIKEHLNIVFIGHVDAGKSTMGGHLLFLTGMVDKRTLEKYEKEAKEAGRESWYLSWALDLNNEERAKGKTVEYGRGYFETEKRRFTILDAPGHKNFVPSMMQGAAQADVGVLVISARKGEFETGFEKGGQTREHAMLAKTVGVKRLILVVNKMDDATVKWDKARYDECVKKILPFLKGVGYSQGKDLDVMPISGFTGANMKDRLSKDVCDWYDGPALIELLDSMSVGDRQFDGPLLMPISDKFNDMGTVVTGKIESGKIRKGQNVLIMPNKKVAEVQTIWMEESEKDIAISGDNVRMRLKRVEEEDVMPGFVMCGIKKPVRAVSVFEARLAIVEYKSIMCAGYKAVCHAHTAVDEITITDLLHKIDKESGKKSAKPPMFVKQGDACIVRIRCDQPICLETFEDYPQLGRFTLRDEGKTIAVGKVTKLIFEDASQTEA